MSFLNPSFLWLAPLAALPVIIHFLNRPKTKSVEFPTIRFLLTATRKVLRKFKILQLLLLLLRVAFILMLLIAFARPVRRAPLADEAVDNIILIDTSYSMSFVTGRDRAIDSAKRLAAALTDNLAGRFALATFNRKLELHIYPTDDKNRIKNAILDIELSPYPSDFNNSLNELAESDIVSDPGAKNIIIFSDFISSGFAGGEIPDIENAEYMLVEVTGSGENVWIEEARAGYAYEQTPIEIICLTDATETSQARIDLYIDGERVRRKEINVSGLKELRFSHTFEYPGKYTGYLSIHSPPEKNRIAPDSVSYFTINVRPRINVLLVDGKPGYTLMGGESYFIERALSPRRYRSPASGRVVTARELIDTDLENYDIVYLLNVSVDTDIERKITDYAASGGSVGIFAGDNTETAAYNRILRHLMPLDILSSNPASAGTSIEPYEGSALDEIFSDSSNQIEIKKLIPASGAAGLEPVLKSGSYPLLFKYPSPDGIQGNMAFFASPLSVKWGSFPLSAQFPVFVHKLTSFLAGRDEEEGLLYISGEALPLRPESRVRFETMWEESEADPQPYLPDSSFPGHYFSNGEIYAVNLQGGGESRIEKLSPSEIRRSFPSGSHFIPYSPSLESDMLNAVLGSEKSSFFLALAAAFLVGEEFLRKYIKRKTTGADQ